MSLSARDLRLIAQGWDAAGCGRQFNAGLVENRGGTRLAASH